MLASGSKVSKRGEFTGDSKAVLVLTVPPARLVPRRLLLSCRLGITFCPFVAVREPCHSQLLPLKGRLSASNVLNNGGRLRPKTGRRPNVGPLWATGEHLGSQPKSDHNLELSMAHRNELSCRLLLHLATKQWPELPGLVAKMVERYSQCGEAPLAGPVVPSRCSNVFDLPTGKDLI